MFQVGFWIADHLGAGFCWAWLLRVCFLQRSVRHNFQTWVLLNFFPVVLSFFGAEPRKKNHQCYFWAFSSLPLGEFSDDDDDVVLSESVDLDRLSTRGIT